MRRFIITSLLLLAVVVLGTGLVLAAPSNRQTTPTPTQTPTQSVPRSLFAEDICVPPCWFGITPGETTAADTLAILRQHEDLFYGMIATSDSIFDLETGQMIDGAYSFYWQPTVWTRKNVTHNTISIIIREGIVSRIRVAINHSVNLAQVLDILGSPTQVVIGNIGDWELILGLYYPDLPLELTLEAIQGGCFTTSMRTHFDVSSTQYYSPNFELVAESYVIFDNIRLVPLEIWETWLHDEVEGTCREAIEQLPIVTPTPMPD